MLELRRRMYWLAALGAYWFCALWLLFYVSPVSVDGSGPTATFYWGNRPPTPSLEDYGRSPGPRVRFLFPYWVASSATTIVGCGVAMWQVRRQRPNRSRLFVVSSAATLFLLLLVAAMSDCGTAVHLWRGPMMYAGVSHALPFLKVMVPMSLLAGALALARDQMKS